MKVNIEREREREREREYSPFFVQKNMEQIEEMIPNLFKIRQG